MHLSVSLLMEAVEKPLDVIFFFYSDRMLMLHTRFTLHNSFQFLLQWIRSENTYLGEEFGSVFERLLEGVGDIGDVLRDWRGISLSWPFCLDLNVLCKAYALKRPSSWVFCCIHIEVPWQLTGMQTTVHTDGPTRITQLSLLPSFCNTF